MTTNMIHLEEIIPSDEQVQTLYRLLEARKHRISHTTLPSYEEHEAFVRDHPYRVWLLVRNADSYIGSVYVHTDNTVGINLLDERVADCFDVVLDQVLEVYDPLPAVKSVRHGSFAINVAPANRALISALETRGYPVAQVTYLVARR